MTRFERVKIYMDALVWFWVALSTAAAVLVGGSEVWWSIETAAGGLTRLVLLWALAIVVLLVWGLR